MKNAATPVITLSTLVALAGFATGQADKNKLDHNNSNQITTTPGNTTNPNTPPRNGTTNTVTGFSGSNERVDWPATSGTPLYRTAEWLLDADVYTSGNQDAADIKDFMIDRGSGRIEYVVLDTKSRLNIGDRLIAVPFQQLRWDSVNKRFILGVGAESLRDMPDYDESWRGTPTNSPDADRDRIRDERRARRVALDEANKSKAGIPVENRLETNTKDLNNPNADRRLNADGTYIRDSDINNPNRSTNNPDRNMNNGDRNNTTDRTATRRDDRTINPNSPNTTLGVPNTNRRQDGTIAGGSNRQKWWDTTDDTYRSDPYASNLDLNNKQRVEGEVKRVSREYVSGQGEQTMLEVLGTDGVTRKVAVGPTWYVGGEDVTFNRGDKVAVETVVMHVATAAKVGDRSMVLRGQDGAATWSNDSFERNGQKFTSSFYQMIRGSELDGNKIVARGVDAGRVDDVILDINSGSVAFLSIDPNDNFLGIADKNRLVPWSVASVSLDGNVRIDATKEMMIASPEAPTDWNDFATNGKSSNVYGAYQIDAPQADRWNDRDNDWRLRDRNRNDAQNMNR